NSFVFFTFLLSLWIHSPIWAQEAFPSAENIPETVTVNQIFIVGNEKTVKNVILREMDIEVGTTYNWNEFTGLVSGDQIKICNLQLFTTVSITPLFTAEDQVELLVSVKERW